jgi:hypothetical protein
MLPAGMGGFAAAPMLAAPAAASVGVGGRFRSGAGGVNGNGAPPQRGQAVPPLLPAVGFVAAPGAAAQRGGAPAPGWGRGRGDYHKGGGARGAQLPPPPQQQQLAFWGMPMGGGAVPIFAQPPGSTVSYPSRSLGARGGVRQ